MDPWHKAKGDDGDKMTDFGCLNSLCSWHDRERGCSFLLNYLSKDDIIIGRIWKK